MNKPHPKGKKQKTHFRLAPPGFQWRPIHFIPFILDTITSIAVVFLPVLVGKIIDLHLTGNTTQAWHTMYWLIAAILYFAINEYYGWGITFRTTALLERDWRLYIGELVKESQNRDAGSLIAILNKDAKALSNLWQPMIMACSAIGITLLGTWQLAVISPLLAIVALTGLLLTILCLTYISKHLEKHSDTFREKVGTNTSKASDIASSIRTILGLGAQKKMMDRYRQSANEVYTAQLKLESVQTWSFAARNMLIGTVTLLVIAFALRGTTIEGHWITDIPAGQLVTIVGLINTLTSPIWSVEMLLYNWRNARVALTRVDRLAAENLAQTTKNTQNDTSYSPNTHTFANLESHSGVTYINPRTLEKTAQEYAEALTTYLRQHKPGKVLLSEPNPMIFAGTLSEHLQLGTTGLTQDTMTQLLKITDSEEIAHRLGGTNPQQYLQSQITSEGTNLSGGQRQRLALARALAQAAETLILTEPLNSVDEPSQKFILDKLETHTGQPGPLQKTKNIFIISTTMETQRRITKNTTPQPTIQPQKTNHTQKKQNHA